MKNKTKVWSALIAATILCTTLYNAAYSQDATGSAEEDETIRENVRRRIEEVVSQSQDARNPSQFHAALIGTLESRTNNTLSIMTREGLSLASTSAQTVFLNQDSDPLELDDISIGDYIGTLGEPEEDTQVVVAQRVIVHDQSPETTLNLTYYGQLVEIDDTQDVATFLNSYTDQNKNFEITNNTELYTLTDDNLVEEIDSVSEVTLHQNMVIIYDADDSNDELPEALKIFIISKHSPSQEATTSAEINPDSE